MARMSGIGRRERERERTAHRWICDFAVLDGYIEIDANEDFFALEIEVCDGEFVGNRHGEEMDGAKAPASEAK